jgi:poly(ADP-ribose) glycohydrolase ARH3
MPGTRSAFLGGMIGSALGDAVGELAFSAGSRESLERMVECTGTLRYTDDTAMAIGIAESICERGGLDGRHLGDTFRRNFRREPWRGYASGPPAVFSAVERAGLSYRQAAAGLFGGQGSFGNGAAMRVTPVGLFYHRTGDLYEKARVASEVTHAHPVGVDGAAVLAVAVAEAVRADPAEGLDAAGVCAMLTEVARTEEIRDKLEQVGGLAAEQAPPGKAASVLGRGIAVQESMPFAVFSFLRYPGSYRDCLLCAVLNRGDCDTLGAMACGISGAYLGIEAVPEEWRGRLENRAYIEELALRLWS